jgi:hypothetical protein
MRVDDNTFSLRAFLMAFGIHICLVVTVLAGLYLSFESKHPRQEDAKIHVLLTNPPSISGVQAQEKIQTTPTLAKNKTQKSTTSFTQSTIKESLLKPQIPLPLALSKYQSEEDMGEVNGKVMGLIRRHYGDIFFELSTAEQEYLIKNIVTIHRIDRRVGNGLLEQKAPNSFHDGDSNYVEMYLYPDGMVTGITLVNEKENRALDELTMETIEQSYAQYPRPNQTTLIRLHTRITKAKSN